MSVTTAADTRPKRLTEYADCAGCASKFAAAELAELMRGVEPPDDERVLVDFRTADDAGVYRWADGPALVQTVDFFTPIVDDPLTFGQIAAANSLSDVYAMGGTPRTALAIAALPKNGPSADVVRAIFKGGADTLRQAGVSLLGGHTVTDPEVKFGYAITGEVDPDRLLTNAGARPGDALVLTKPLGTGIIVRARRYGQGTDEELAAASAIMTRLNDAPARVARALAPGAVRACTDVTGFGLAGHASEMASASGVTLSFEAASLPVLPGVLRLAAEFLPCGGRANLKHFRGFRSESTAAPELHLVCLDPQTSGGLLLSMDSGVAGEFVGRLTDDGASAAIVGEVEPRRSRPGATEDEPALVRLI
jgi:selenide,water dikinase